MKILIDVPPAQPGFDRLKELGGFQVDCLESDPDEQGPRPADPARIRDADVVFCSFPPANLDDMRSLKWIQLASSGYSQLFGLDLPGRGIIATNCRGCIDTPIAEWNIAMMVNLVRDLPRMLRNQAAAIWERPAVFQREIRGLTVGLWGYGGIARETARFARIMGMRIHVLTRNGITPRQNCFSVPGTGDPEGTLPHRVFRAGQEMDFLSELDFLIVCLPLTRITEGLIGERELRALPQRAFLLNPARGPIIREPALIRALKEQWFSGAALDTHYQYPLPTDHPLWKMPNVILTPHISGSSLSRSFFHNLGDMFVQNVNRFAGGEPLLNQLTAAQLAGE
jgi:phosphoglycerate dehydrogenase-like enzyme